MAGMWVGIERHQHPPHSLVSLTCPSLRHPKRTYDPSAVAITRYRYRAANIPTPWSTETIGAA